MYATIRQKQAHQALLRAIEEAPTTIPCAETDPDLFFTSDENPYKDSSPVKTRQAKSLCEICPVMAKCADYAVMYFENQGIWGGTTPRERQEIRSKMGIVRPPSMANQPFPEFW